MSTFKEMILVLLFLAGALISADGFCADSPMHVVVDANAVSIHEGQGVLLRYPYRDVPYKPYVQQLYTPNGINVLRDAPHDHLHHHALMYAISVDGVNFWEEQNAPGRQRTGWRSEIPVRARRRRRSAATAARGRSARSDGPSDTR